MSIVRRSFAVLCSLAALPAQQSPGDRAAATNDPLALVARAEALLQGKETEGAILVLWQTLELLPTLASSPVHDAALLSARFLLMTHDPRETQRRAVFASVAKQQVELAAAYRAKKWLDVAATRLAVADTFDAEVGIKERALLAAARPKSKAVEKPAAAEPSKPKLSPLLQQGSAALIHGEWREVDDRLECQAPPETASSWTTTETHADHEVVVEFRPADATKPHNATLSVGWVVDPATNNYGGYRFQCSYDPKVGMYGLVLWNDTENKQLAHSWVPAAPTSDGFRRLSIQVNGPRLRAQLDLCEPLEVVAPADVRGHVALMNGMLSVPTCAVQFRNLRIDPLPADMPTDDELRAQNAAAHQNAITKAVDEAKDLIGKKQPEAASLRLRDALGLVSAMEPGILRDTLAKTIEPMLQQTDPLAARRKKTAQTNAAELATLADEYAKAGMVRTAELLVERAADFDPEGQKARLAAAREAVTKWNAEQAAARGTELAPPADDGTVLREWFAKGRKLDTYTPPMVVEGAEARAVDLPAESFVGWLARPLAKKITKASVHVHLTANGEEGGLCFDVVDGTQFGVAFVQRTKNGMRLYVMFRIE